MNIDPLLTKIVGSDNDMYKITVCFDEHVDESPREWSNTGILACAHRRYKIGDDKSKIGYDFASQLAVEGSWDEMEEWIRIHYDPVVLKRVYMYDHSGIALSTSPFSCPWDSGQVGFMYATRASVMENYGISVITPEFIVKTVEAFEHEIKIYNDYLQGSVYGYKIEHNSTEIESCWGFYGDPQEVMQEAESVLQSLSRKSA